LKALQTSKECKDDKHQRFDASGTFMAVLASEIVVHKLAGFVKDHNAILEEVTRERVVLQLPGGGWLSYFSTSPERQAVQLELNIERSDRASDANKTKIQYELRPVGWHRDLFAFESRSKAILKELKQYFVAE
jgi:hypothetical protein